MKEQPTDPSGVKGKVHRYFRCKGTAHRSFRYTGTVHRSFRYKGTVHIHPDFVQLLRVAFRFNADSTYATIQTSRITIY